MLKEWYRDGERRHITPRHQAGCCDILIVVINSKNKPTKNPLSKFTMQLGNA